MTIETGSDFIGVDFSGADMSQIKSKYDSQDSAFAADFVGCNFRETKFHDGNLDNFNFQCSDFQNADFCKAQLNSNFNSSDLERVKTDNNTSTSHIRLSGKDYEDAHTVIGPESKKNEIIKNQLEEMDENLKKIILRDKSPNLEGIVY